MRPTKALIQVFAVNSSTMLCLRGVIKGYLQTEDRYVGIGRFRHLIYRWRLKSGCSDSSKEATDFDLVND
jgi:hypothetical protein